MACDLRSGPPAPSPDRLPAGSTRLKPPRKVPHPLSGTHPALQQLMSYFSPRNTCPSRADLCHGAHCPAPGGPQAPHSRGQDRACMVGGHWVVKKGFELAPRQTSRAGRRWGECPLPFPTAPSARPQCTAPPATTTTPPPTGASAAPWAPTSPSLARTTASPARATPARTSMAPPTSHTAKVGTALRAAGRGKGAGRRGAGCWGRGKPSPHTVPTGPQGPRPAPAHPHVHSR